MLRGDRRPAQALHVVHDRGRARHGRSDPEHLGRGAPGPGREPRVPAPEPPARLPDLRPGRRVPAAGPGDGVRPRREPVHRAEADVREADRALAARQARPRTLCVVRALHALLRRDQRRPVHRAVRSRRGRTRVDRGGRGLPFAVLRQHGADLPGRSAHRRAVPFRRAAVRPLDGGLRVPALQRRLQRPRRPAPRIGRARPRAGQRGGERRLDVRQGAVRVPSRRPAGSRHDAADPRSRARAGLVRRGLHEDRRVVEGWPGGVPHGWTAARRRRVRALQARANRVRNQRPRSPADVPRRSRRAPRRRVAARHELPGRGAREGDPRRGAGRGAGGADPQPADPQGRAPRRRRSS